MRRTILVRKRTMQTAADETFPLLGLLVERAQAQSGSRMNAYADVARSIGASGSWVRKFLGRQPVRLDADTYRNIKALYAAKCARWDAEAELQRARFFALGKGDDAMAQITTERLDVDASRHASRNGSQAAVVAPLVDANRQ